MSDDIPQQPGHKQMDSAKQGKMPAYSEDMSVETLVECLSMFKHAGEALRWLREGRGLHKPWTQQQVAAGAYLDVGEYCRIEQGKSNASRDVLICILVGGLRPPLSHIDVILFWANFAPIRRHAGWKR